MNRYIYILICVYIYIYIYTYTYVFFTRSVYPCFTFEIPDHGDMSKPFNYDGNALNTSPKK